MKYFLIASIFAVLGYTGYTDYKFNESLKSGEIRLECNIQGKGLIEIEPERIVSFDADRNVVTFDNGYASNCQVIK